MLCLYRKVANISQSWHQDRLDLAEHFFARMESTRTERTSAVAEDMVDLFLEIGRGLLDKGCANISTIWLKRAFELLQYQQLEALSPDAGELRLNLLHTYGTIYPE